MSVPWMPLYVADYLADTGHLNAAEHGAYMLLIMHYWRQGELPTEDGHLQRIARMTATEWKRSRDTLSALFQDGWTHKRIDAELAKSAQKSTRRAEAGSRGGKIKSETVKALKSLDADVANATILLEQNGKQNHADALASSSQPQSEAVSRNSTEPRHSAPSGAADGRLSLKRAFELWYSGYPNKKGRFAAVKAFEKVSKQKIATFEQLMLGLDRYLKFGNAKYWQHPASWLNGGHWLDEYPGAPRLNKSRETDDPKVDFGGGFSAPISSIRANIERGFWPEQWGGKIGEPGCRVPERFWGDLLPKKPEAGRLRSEMVH